MKIRKIFVPAQFSIKIKQNNNYIKKKNSAVQYASGKKGRF